MDKINRNIEIDFIRYFIPKLKYVDETTIINLIEPGIYKFGLKINFDSTGSAGFSIHTQYYNGSAWVTDEYSEANQTWGGSDEFYSEYMVYAKQWTTWRLRIGPNVAVSFATAQWSRLMISKVA